MDCSPSSLDKSGTLGKCRKPRQVQGGNKEFYSLLSTSHEPSKAKVIVAPVCPAGKTTKDMICHCSKEAAVQGIDGNSRGGCVPSPNQEQERANGWCFLENIRNPVNGTENCFEDAKWSVVDGRFWSNMACIDEYKKKEEERIKPGLQLLDVHTPPELQLVDAPALVELQPLDGGLLDVHIPLDLKPLDAPTPEPIPMQNLKPVEKIDPDFDSKGTDFDLKGCMSGYKWDGRYCADKRDKYCGHIPFEEDIICSMGGGLLAAPTQSGLQLLDELHEIDGLEKLIGNIPNPEPLPIQSKESFEKLGADFDSKGCMSGYKWDGRYCADKRDKYCGHIPFDEDIICSMG